VNVLILAAGYATRLYPLTLKKAKPLLEVGGKPMIEWVLGTLAGVQDIETFYVVTNAKFAADFQAWADRYQVRQGTDSRWRDRHRGAKIKIVNDGSTSDDDKLGAIGDIQFVLNRERLSESGLLIVAGDNLFSDSLEEFVAQAKTTDAMVAVYDVGDKEVIRNYGNIDIDAQETITHFEEKPEKPRSTLAAIALYYYSPKVLALIPTYLAAGNNPDQPGRFVQWLYTRQSVKTFQLRGKWLDIGSKETLEKANEAFSSASDNSLHKS
jgi:glucose-1-phosphate thymidylyltransferase